MDLVRIDRESHGSFIQLVGQFRYLFPPHCPQLDRVINKATRFTECSLWSSSLRLQELWSSSSHTTYTHSVAVYIVESSLTGRPLRLVHPKSFQNFLAVVDFSPMYGLRGSNQSVLKLLRSSLLPPSPTLLFLLSLLLAPIDSPLLPQFTHRCVAAISHSCQTLVMANNVYTTSYVHKYFYLAYVITKKKLRRCAPAHSSESFKYSSAPPKRSKLGLRQGLL